ncbi:MAG: hypothetical protein HUU08_13190 [Candidatus Brocadia sp.]|nr:hypothetical protein [Candidatus Brocadia sp.]
MSKKKRRIHDKDIENVEAALLRAAKRAREIARQTHTPLVYYQNGHVVKEFIEQNEDRDDTTHFLPDG